MASVTEAQRAPGCATILAIGRANPQYWHDQSKYPDFYFRVTNSEHMTELKTKMKHICDKAQIKKRHTYLTEEILKEIPNFCSLDVKQDMAEGQVQQLGKEAAMKAITEWGQPKSKITHLIFCTTIGPNIPGHDYQLLKLLGLDPSVKRIMLYQQGCHGGGTVLRLAKDIVENNKGARVLAVCCEVVTTGFYGPSDIHLTGLVSNILFADGAAVLIVGADPVFGAEKPIFEVVSTTQTILPDSNKALWGCVRESGFTMHIGKEVPNFISNNIENMITKAFKPFGILDWNSIFWIVHPGGPAILDQVEAKLGLEPDKLCVSRHVLAEYGNMSSVTVLFILNEMRKKSFEDGLMTTGEGLEWGVLFGFGPGVTIETVVLRSVDII